ncbi:MAG: arginase family protein [Microbacteriaceae bacterium]
MALSVDPLWPRAGDWPDATGGPVDVGLIGIPTWRTSLSPTSAFTTPAKIREAMRYYSHFAASAGAAGVAAQASRSYAQWPDVEEPDLDEAAATQAVAVAAALSRLLIVLGGDNAATVAGALGTWGERTTAAGLVTLDAHHDVRDGISNGSPVRRLIEAGLAGTRVVQVGIADFANSVDYAKRAADFGITVIHRDVLHIRPMNDVMAEALEIAASGGGPVHVDLDVDVCDRSVAPACPAAIPGGLAAHELRSAARSAGQHSAVESIDITEVDAAADAPDGRTVRLAALCVLEAVEGFGQRA